MDQLFTDVGAMFRGVFLSGHWLGFLDPMVWLNALNKPGVFAAALVVLNVIVFTETGLLVGFLLPGDSLLVIVGMVASLLPEWSVPVLIGTLSVSAILGDSVGYWVGAKAGPAIFRRPDGRLFRQAYLTKAREFYARHGGKTIIYARFVPFIRTFAPVVAGAARMEYRRFLAYNVVGGVAWITSMILVGYVLIDLVEPGLKRVFGPGFMLAKQMDKIILVVVFASVAPLLWKGGKAWLAGRAGRRAADESPAATTPAPTV